MEYTVLYRKYRPKSFDDVYGQEIIVKILKNAIKNGKVCHAYLFAGVRGTGKTSIAKIFAKAVNCPNNNAGNACNECETCKKLEQNDIDIIEIDAASNNGVDEIREIRNNAKLVPSVAKYKVYIIDEVHMLSTGAFNALLKTLEEPPQHVIFILATTEVQKIPLTILSRCQRFDFKKISNDVLLKRLNYILKNEQKTVDEKILKLICELGDGSLRDAINLLDQIMDVDDVNEEFLYKLSGNISPKIVQEFLKLIRDANTHEILIKIEEFTENGINFIRFVDKLLILLRDISINNAVHNYFSQEYSDLLEEYDIDSELIKKLSSELLDLITELKKSTNQRITFEIFMISITNFFVKNENEINLAIEQKCTTVSSTKPNQKMDDSNVCSDRLLEIRINNTLATADKNLLLNLTKKFKNIEKYISNKKYNNLARAMLETKIVCAGRENIILEVKTESAMKILNQNLSKSESLLSQVLDNEYKLALLTEKNWDKVKLEFINNKKNNVKYEIIPENNVKIDNEEKSDTESEAIKLFGQESIAIK